MIKKIIIGALFIIIVAIGGRGVWAWQAVKTEEDAKSALKNAVVKSAELQSFSFIATTTVKVAMKPAEMSASIAAIEGLPSSFKFNVFTNGDVDLRLRENPSFDTSFDATVETEKTATTSASLSLSAHQIIFNKNNYLNFSKFEIALTSIDPKLSGAQVIIGMINGVGASLKNKWIKADPSAIPTESVTVSSFAAGDVSSILGDKRIAGYLEGMSYLKSTTLVAKEQIMGHPVYHLNLVFQYEKQIFDLLRQVSMEKGAVQPEQVEAFNKNLDSFSKSFEGKSFTVNIWVGQNDPLIYRILIQDFTFEDTVNKINLTLTQDTSLSNHNKEFSITAPQEALTLEEIIENIFGSAFGNARDKGADASIKSNLSNLRAQAELYYDRNNISYGAWGNCSMSSTGVVKTILGTCSQNIMGDPNFRNGIKGAAIASGATGYVNVSTGGQAWASFVPLKSTPTSWWCVDSKGAAKVLLAAPLKTALACS